MNRENLIWKFGVPASLLLLCFPPVLDGPLTGLDQSIWLSVQQALSSGRVLYRDVWFQYGPLLPLPIYSFCELIGPSLGAVRWAIWIMNAAGLLVMYGCVVRFIENKRLRLFLSLSFFLIPAAMLAFTPSSARYAAPFLSLLFWPKPGWTGARIFRWSLVSGVAAGAGLFISQEAGVAGAAAGFVYFFLCDRRLAIPYAASFAGAGTFGLIVLHFTCGLESFLQCAIFDIGRLMSVMALSKPPLKNVHDAAMWGALIIPSFAAAAGVGLAWRNKRISPLVAGLIALVLLSAVTAWTRSDKPHIYFALSSGFFLAAVLIDQERETWKLLVFALFGAFVVLPPFFVQRAFNRPFEESFRRLSLDRGGAARVPDFQAAVIEEVARKIQDRVPEGESIFVYPMDGWLYFLANRVSPSRHWVPLQSALRSHQEDVVVALESNKTRWVLKNEAVQNLDGKPVEAWLPLEAAYLAHHFTRRDAVEPFVFYERKP